MDFVKKEGKDFIYKIGDRLAKSKNLGYSITQEEIEPEDLENEDLCCYEIKLTYDVDKE